MRDKNVYIIGGPNGSGKTTFAKKFLPEYAKCPNFVNTDLIAQGLSPFSPRTAAIKAGKIVLQQIHEFAQKGADFAFESTLSGKLYANFFKKLKSKDYKIHLFFLWIPHAELALARIEDRVSTGGHDVPAQDVERRFSRSIYNFFNLYQPLVNYWILFNNAGPMPNLIAKGRNGQVTIADEVLYEKIKKLASKI